MKTHRFSDLNIDRSNMILIDKNKNNLSQYFGTNKRVPVIEEFCNSIILVYMGNNVFKIHKFVSAIKVEKHCRYYGDLVTMTEEETIVFKALYQSKSFDRNNCY
ncbi:MAG: hypothetical protein PF569_09100, partial [Candidatus Woesearchaeota archaeon]|nr:hypothetical protein [Candidatus Woesearchaeota archaeon]